MLATHQSISALEASFLGRRAWLKVAAADGAVHVFKKVNPHATHLNAEREERNEVKRDHTSGKVAAKERPLQTKGKWKFAQEKTV